MDFQRQSNIKSSEHAYEEKLGVHIGDNLVGRNELVGTMQAFSEMWM